MWVSKDAAPYESNDMFVDASGRGKDETEYACLKLLHGRLFLVASDGFLGGYDDATLVSLLRVAKKHGITNILVEPNYGGGMFTKLLQSQAQRHYLCGIADAEWSTVSKEQRIVDVLEPVLNQHRLIVCPSSPGTIPMGTRRSCQWHSRGADRSGSGCLPPSRLLVVHPAGPQCF